MACPEISLLPMIADALETSIDSLFGYKTSVMSDYEQRYQSEDFYWGLEPNGLCYEIMKLKPPVRPTRVLDMGCGEGKDATVSILLHPMSPTFAEDIKKSEMPCFLKRAVFPSSNGDW